ncbi:hypothetical protein SH580_19705 [Coraliomargarita algicola]|uniref:NrS-1 polymerase-like helicase domain-containing protein n=1 Tax=Coraliomargarita algicola TaxID=3092156 RepID=A0ABZ0RL48_9BACT|nr:DUF5906 domain-containing protein [Coraliomargarita sp. J2-16]WPJ95647.1 hypothetical protein SH580_19705 [Coraliomargarita sp. J2-16]
MSKNSETGLKVDPPRKRWRESWFLPGDSFYIPNKRGEWVVLTRADMVLELKAQGLRNSLSEDEVKSGKRLSECEAAILEIKKNQVLDYCGLLAGYKAGFYRLNGRKVLVTHSQDMGTECAAAVCWNEDRLTAFADGLDCGDSAIGSKWVDDLRELNIETLESEHKDAARFPILWRFFNNLFNRDDYDQRHLVWGIMQDTYTALVRGCSENSLPSQAPALFIAGEPSAGKTLLSEIMRVIYGGRRGFPYEYLTGTTNFNEELFEATLMLIDDEADKTDIRSRHNLSQKLKQFTVGAGNRLHGKGAKALESAPLWRVLMLCNTDEDSLRVLPPIDMCGDKFVLLKAHGESVPLTTDSPLKKRMLWSAIVEELPFFKHWLRNVYELPKEWGPTHRFPVKPWHHPGIVDIIEDVAPWRETWDLLCNTLMRHGMIEFNGVELPEHCYVATCQAMIDELREHYEVYKLTRAEAEALKVRSIGRYLKQVEARNSGHAIQRRDSNGTRYWWLSRDGVFKRT